MPRLSPAPRESHPTTKRAAQIVAKGQAPPGTAEALALLAEAISLSRCSFLIAPLVRPRCPQIPSDS